MDRAPNPHPKKTEPTNSSSQSRPKIYHCTECDRKFDRPSLLSQVDVPSCDAHQNELLTVLYLMSQHILVHTGERR